MVSNDVMAKIATLRRQFQVRLIDDSEHLRKLWQNWVEQGIESDRQQILNLTHSLKGSSGTFGFSQISAQAALLEAALDAQSQNKAMVQANFTALLAAIDLVIEQGQS
ncbi:Hpt domain-containing protein [Reinekea sp.]|jgi:HPt (histidine-containing phosphotransfer) domain-containing protein|uniref:Hpt domain-containing protein n=1 Tax=Reinekea sp. TaxID=1970455 RepID=UPI003989BB0C